MYSPSIVLSIPEQVDLGRRRRASRRSGSLPKTITPARSSLRRFFDVLGDVLERPSLRTRCGMLCEASIRNIVVSRSFRRTVWTSARARTISVTTAAAEQDRQRPGGPSRARPGSGS